MNYSVIMIMDEASCSSHLAEDDGHEEEVEQQRLRQVAVVEGEEEDGEEDGDVLVGGAAVGGAQQLQARHRDHQRADPEGGGVRQTDADGERGPGAEGRADREAESRALTLCPVSSDWPAPGHCRSAR